MKSILIRLNMTLSEVKKYSPRTLDESTEMSDLLIFIEQHISRLNRLIAEREELRRQ